MAERSPKYMKNKNVFISFHSKKLNQNIFSLNEKNIKKILTD